MYKHYKKGMQVFGLTDWESVKDEFKELLEDKSFEELSDVIHSLLRWMKAPCIISFLLAYPTAKKHALRVKEYGCPRSKRNHEKLGEDCCCKQ